MMIIFLCIAYKRSSFDWGLNFKQFIALPIHKSFSKYLNKKTNPIALGNKQDFNACEIQIYLSHFSVSFRFWPRLVY